MLDVMEMDCEVGRGLEKLRIVSNDFEIRGVVLLGFIKVENLLIRGATLSFTKGALLHGVSYHQ
jgi:hypothetical protein